MTHSAPSRFLPEGALIADRYRIVELLGVGGMGVVYRVVDERLEQEVALKTLRVDSSAGQETFERFRQELILARRVSHRNVVRIHDLGEDGDLKFLTMDLVTGRPLSQAIEDGPLPLDEALRVACDLAGGLAAIHDEGIVHRDLKPSNVLLDPSGRAHITDFGIARSLRGRGLTQPGSIVGTPDYLSPEQARGDELDHRSDLYALGLIMFEMLSGERPFRGHSDEEILAQRTVGRAKDISTVTHGIPSWVRSVVRRNLERNPEDRYPNAVSLLADLRAQRTSRVRHRWLGRAAVLSLAMLATGAGTWMLVERRPTPADREATSLASSGLESGRRIAILPAVAKDNSVGQRWLAVGLPEMLSRRLSESPSLHVVSPERSEQLLRDLHLETEHLNEAQIRNLGRLMDVDRVFVPRYDTSRDLVQLSGRLYDVAGKRPSRHLTTKAFTSIADALGTLVQSLESALEMSEHPGDDFTSTSSAALAAFSRGIEQQRKGATLDARKSFETAVVDDPHFVAAEVQLAKVLLTLGLEKEATDMIQRVVSQVGESQARIAFDARALHAELMGRGEGTLDILEERVTRFPRDHDAKLSFAEALGDRGHLKRAIDTLTELSEQAPKNPRVWYLLGKFAILSGRTRQAADEYLVRALLIQNRVRNEQGRADVLNALGIAYYDLGDLDRAVEHYQGALSTRRTLGDRRGIAMTLLNLAQIHSRRGEYERAANRLAEALKIQEALGDRSVVAGIHSEYGALREQEGRFDEALESYRSALAVYKAIQDGRGVAQSYNNIGFISHVLGRYADAEVYWGQALAFFEDSENAEGTMLVQQSVGLLHIIRGRWDKATAAFVDTLETARALERKDAEAVSLGGLGVVARHEGRYDAALSSIRRAQALVTELGDLRGEVEFGLSAAGCLLAFGDYAAAGKALDALNDKLSREGNAEQRADFRRLRAALASLAGDRAGAHEHLEQALLRAKESGSITTELRVRLVKSEISYRLGDLESAARELRGVITRAEKLGHVPLSLQGRQWLGRVERALKKHGEARRVLTKALREANLHAPYEGTWMIAAQLAKLSSKKRDQARFARILAKEERRITGALPPGGESSFARLKQEVVGDTLR